MNEVKKSESIIIRDTKELVKKVDDFLKFLDTTEEIKRFRKALPDLIKETENVVKVENDNDKQKVGEAVFKAQKISKEAEETRMKFKTPVNQIGNDLQKYFKDDIIKPLDEKITEKINQISEYTEMKKRQIEEEERIAYEKAENERKKREAILLERSKKAEGKGNFDKAESLKEQAENVIIPIQISQPIEKTTQLENGKMTNKDNLKIIHLDVLEIMKGFANESIPLHYANIICDSKTGEPKSISIIGFKKFMSSKFGYKDKTYCGITVKRHGSLAFK